MTRQKTSYGWGSRNAEALFQIAVRLGGFDAVELMTEIHRLSKSDCVYLQTIENAMQIVADRHKED